MNLVIVHLDSLPPRSKTGVSSSKSLEVSPVCRACAGEVGHPPPKILENTALSR